MSSKNEIRSLIADYIAGQVANTESAAAAKLALGIRDAVKKYREDDGENLDALSIDADYEDGEFTVRVSFVEDSRMTIMCSERSDPIVRSIWLGLPEADEELAFLAGLMLSEGWVHGFTA